MSTTVQQAPGLTRTDLQRRDPSVPGREVKNVGSGNAAELATYFVEKDKPSLVVVE